MSNKKKKAELAELALEIAGALFTTQDENPKRADRLAFLARGSGKQLGAWSEKAAAHCIEKVLLERMPGMNVDDEGEEVEDDMPERVIED